MKGITFMSDGKSEKISAGEKAENLAGEKANQSFAPEGELTEKELDGVSGGLIALLRPATAQTPSVSEVNGDISGNLQGNLKGKVWKT